MKDFTKIVRIGKGEEGDIYCKVSYLRMNLSIMGVIGPYATGYCKGSCGQIKDEIAQESVRFAPEWDADLLARFLQIWKDYHLNEIQAGSPAQTKYLKEMEEKYKYSPDPKDHYLDWARARLESAGLQPDPNHLIDGRPYSYGTRWLRIDVPVDVMEFLKALPDTDKEPAWV